MECRSVDKIKPLDVLLEDQIREFESGHESFCDKDLDREMWELSRYREESPDSVSREFGDEYVVED